MFRRFIERIWPPCPGAPAPDTKIENVRLVALDCETTGLDPRRDRIVSLAALSIMGNVIDETPCIDRLVNPGCPIPERSTTIHGIRDEDVACAAPFADLLPELVTVLHNAVLLGHEIAFDAAMIRQDARRAGQIWREPPLVDTMLLAAAVLPATADLRLESVASQCGVTIRGRHTALGDARAAAEIYLHLLPMLTARNLDTIGDLLELCRTQRRALQVRTGQRW